MKPANFIVRCYAERDQDGSWFAMCIDLNLYARADSLPEVRNKIHYIIKDYIEEAATVDKEYFEDLIQRPAPLYFWIRYYWIALQLHFHRAAQNLSSIKFHEYLPLKPA